MSSGTTKQTEDSQDLPEFAKHKSRVLYKEPVANNVNLYIVEKPSGLDFRPGQTVDLSIDEDDWREAKRPFTFTSLPHNARLEFVIKSYPKRDGVTDQLQRDVEVNDNVLLSDPWGAIKYEGPGVFLAGGAGITPFLAIFRDLERKGELSGNRLYFSNKTTDDVIMQGELSRMLGHDAVFTLTQQRHDDYAHGRIDKQWLEKHVDDFNQKFYLCGPPQMIKDLRKALTELGASEDDLINESLS